jgi:hypothetical protein
MVRLTGLISMGLVLFLALAIGGMRWIGRQRAPGEFPLPSPDGCWESICFLGELGLERVPAVLNAHPDVVSGSAALVPDLQPGGYQMVEFVYAPRLSYPTPVLLYWANHSYNLLRDWRRESNPPLMRLGSVLVALGAPERVSLLADQIVLHYPARHLEVMVLPARRGMNWAHLSPVSPVIALFVLDASLASNSETVYYPPSEAWHGFGEYRFEE